MKNYLSTLKYFAGSTAIAAIVIVSISLYKNSNSLINKLESKFEKEEENEAQEIAGALEYYKKIKTNYVTGTIDINDMNKALLQRAALKKSKTSTTSMVWKELGPDNVGGRVRAIIVDNQDHNTLWAGSVSGGLWKSKTLGSSWEKVTTIDDENYAISCITQAPNGDIYVGTGEADIQSLPSGLGLSSAQGAGVFKSSDGGNTFSRLTSTWENSTEPSAWENVNRLAVDPKNSSRIYAATSSGLRISNDGGSTWGKAFMGTSSCKCIAVSSTGSVICDNGSTTVYISPNGDSGTYTKISGSLADNLIYNSKVSRYEFAFAPSDPNYVYCAAGSSDDNDPGLSNIYQSTDGGYTWTVIGPGGSSLFQPIGTQTNYAVDIAVSLSNPGKIFVGGLDIWSWSENDGWEQKSLSFSSTSHQMHSDQHIIVCDPYVNNLMFFGCDGGIFQSKDGGETFSSINSKLNITQFYAVAYSNDGKVMGGAQDNGTQMIDYSGNTVQTATEVNGGDGFYCDFSMINPNASFASVYSSDAKRASSIGGNYSNFYPDKISYGDFGTDIFVTPLRLWEQFDTDGNPVDTSFVVGFTGAVWMTKQALDFSITPEWFQILSVSSSEQANTFAFSADGDNIYIATNKSYSSSKLYRISNLLSARDSASGDVGSAEYSLVSTQIAGFSGRIITSVTVDPNDGDHVIVTLGNFGSTDYIYETKTATTDPASTSTSNFTSIQGDLPEAPVYTALVTKSDSKTIFVGTEYGVYKTEDGGTSWTVEDGIDPIPVFMIRQQTTTPENLVSNPGVIYVATHGRGFYSSESLMGVKEIAQSNKNNISGLKVYPNPISEKGTIGYYLKENTNVDLSIYDMQGKLVKSINLGKQNSGTHTTQFDTAELRSGSYFVMLKAGESKAEAKLLVMK